MAEKLYYHYTNVASANSILSNGSIWITHARYLNDSNELDYAIDLFLKQIHANYKKAFSAAFQYILEQKMVCIFSLSSDPKTLSQWRAYGDDAHGVALGFTESTLLRKNTALKFLDREIHKELVECVYENHDYFIKDLLNKKSSEIDKITDLYKQFSISNLFYEALDNETSLIATIITELLRLKNIAFIEEKESRLVIHAPSEKINTRVSKNLIIPFFEYQLIDKEEKKFLFAAIPEIWLGPKCDERNIHALGFMTGHCLSFNERIKRFDCGYI